MDPFWFALLDSLASSPLSQGLTRKGYWRRPSSPSLGAPPTLLVSLYTPQARTSTAQKGKRSCAR